MLITSPEIVKVYVLLSSAHWIMKKKTSCNSDNCYLNCINALKRLAHPLNTTNGGPFYPHMLHANNLFLYYNETAGRHYKRGHKNVIKSWNAGNDPSPVGQFTT